ncbi:DUF2213 domain-containing protein [Pasteurella canis]|uniref:DUF2213 domain-containing protein n=1 Tax=Pasteurella canis TaxID=753 RepID=UPI000D886407|nr:DUF2213 domain-containing protein [Pasteurella canis]UEA17464.1 DUF2213 domain-containing protein [Pasteurella canis]SPY33224.1 Uncharacterized protein conserved in bacteria [Pasteurella canis]
MKFTDKGSSQRAVTKDGYLVVPATISKVGVFDYHASELGLQETAVKKVARTENSLFSDRTLASFEGVPLTIGHPEQGVNAKNWKDLSVGVVRNVKRVGDTLAAEAWVYDDNAIKLIQDEGIEELSCGYDCDIVTTTVQDADFEMSPMIGNHVAIVAKGRCGPTVKFADEDKSIMSKSVKFLDALLGAFGIKLSDEQKQKVEEEEKKEEGEKQPSKPETKPENTVEKDEEKTKEKTKVNDAALVQENEQLKAQIKQLQDAQKSTEEESKRTALLADAKVHFVDITFTDKATVREIQQSAVVSTGIFSEDEAKALSDAEMAGAYVAAKATAKKLADQNLGRVLIGDAKPAQRFDFNSYNQGAK